MIFSELLRKCPMLVIQLTLDCWGFVSLTEQRQQSQRERKRPQEKTGQYYHGTATEEKHGQNRGEGGGIHKITPSSTTKEKSSNEIAANHHTCQPVFLASADLPHVDQNRTEPEGSQGECTVLAGFVST